MPELSTRDILLGRTEDEYEESPHSLKGMMDRGFSASDFAKSFTDQDMAADDPITQRYDRRNKETEDFQKTVQETTQAVDDVVESFSSAISSLSPIEFMEKLPEIVKKAYSVREAMAPKEEKDIISEKEKLRRAGITDPSVLTPEQEKEMFGTLRAPTTGEKLASFVGLDATDIKEAPKQGLKSLIAGGARAFGSVGNIIKWVGDNIFTEKETVKKAMEARGFEYKPNMVNDFVDNINKAVSKFGGKVSSEWEQIAKKFDTPNLAKLSFEDAPFSKAATAIGGSAPLSLSALAVALVTKNPGLAGAMFGAVEGSSTYVEARKAGKDFSKANLYGLLNAAWNSVTERIPFEGMLASAGKKTIQRVASGFTTESVQELIQTVGSNVIEKYGFDEGRDIMDGWIEAIVAGGFFGGVGGAVIKQSEAENKLKDEVKKEPVSKDQELSQPKTLDTELTEEEKGKPPVEIKEIPPELKEEVKPKPVKELAPMTAEEVEKAEFFGFKKEEKKTEQKPAENNYVGESLPKSGLVVANIGADGKVYVGKKGDLHFSLSERHGKEIRKKEKLVPGEGTWKSEGFIGSDGKYLTREEALKKVEVKSSIGDELDALDLREQTQTFSMKEGFKDKVKPEAVKKEVVEKPVEEVKPAPLQQEAKKEPKGPKVEKKLTEEESRLEEVVTETAESVDEFINKAQPREVKLGVSFGAPIKGKTVEKINIPEGEEVESVSSAVEKRWQKSKGIKKTPIMDKVKEAYTNLKHQFTRSHPELDPKNVTDAQVADKLRQFDTTPEYATVTANEVLKGITAGLGPKGYDVFTRNIILPDLARDIDKGMFKDKEGNMKELPFGYQSKEEVQSDLDRFQKIMEENPNIKRSYEARQKFMDTIRKDLVDKGLLHKDVLKNESYFHHQVLQFMQDPINFKPGLSTADLRLKKKGWQKSRVGSSKDFNTDYLQAEFEVISQSLSQLETKKTMDEIKEIADISKDLNSLAKEREVSVESLIPAGYVKWKPDKRNLLYRGSTVSDKIIEQVIAGEKMLEDADVKKALMVGKRPEWIIPENIANTLDNLRDYKDEGVLADVSRNLLSTWKQWILINPFRVLKYNLNNTSGDLDIAFAYNPKILKYVPKSMKELYSNLKGGAMTSEIRTALKKGVIGSGITVEEIPDITKEGAFSLIRPESEKDIGVIQKIWKTSKDWTTYRENILRLAAYKHFKKELATGKKNIYAASRKSEIDALKDNDDKAAKLARELIGDYGNISKSGQWLRKHMIPFYSWIEVNAPRYGRLLKNLKHEGDTGKNGARLAGTLAWKGTKLGVKMATLMGLVQLWNKTFFPDEEEEFKKANRRQLHLILGRNDDGSIRSIRFQGAFSDVLSWVGLEHAFKDVHDLYTGEKEPKKQIEETAKAIPVKLIGSLRPEPKLLYEGLTKQSLYPDPFSPRPIRDVAEHLSRIVSADKVYKWAMGKPTRGLGKDLASLLVYTSEPGEVAYYGIRQKVYDWLEKTGEGDAPRFIPSKKSNKLYYFKQALRFGDKKAARKYLNEYADLGGTAKGLKSSIKRSHPIGFLSKEKKIAFLETLDKDDAMILKEAIKWYNSVYKGNEVNNESQE